MISSFEEGAKCYKASQMDCLGFIQGEEKTKKVISELIWKLTEVLPRIEKKSLHTARIQVFSNRDKYGDEYNPSS